MDEIRWVKVFESKEALENFVPLLKINTIHFDGRKVCITHTSKGFFAIQDRCPHNGASLSFGKCSDEHNSIVCPLHRYHFNLETGRAMSGGADAGRTYPIKITEEGVFLGIKEFSWKFW